MQVFLDVEFTSFERPELLSAGLCTADGRECYVELDTRSASGRRAAARSSSFVHDTVLPQFGLIPSSETDRKAMGCKVATWLIELGTQPIYLVFDHPADLALLERLIRGAGLWSRARPLLRPVDLSEVIGTPEADAASNASWNMSERVGGPSRHHALVDARALRDVTLLTKVGHGEFQRRIRAPHGGAASS